ncbi:hypothetical protein POG22_10335 [Geitlerinema sp. CS-897]|nr:hypothetical protein [Geitlerinema sp. CS-897]
MGRSRGSLFSTIYPNAEDRQSDDRQKFKGSIAIAIETASVADAIWRLLPR